MNDDIITTSTTAPTIIGPLDIDTITISSTDPYIDIGHYGTIAMDIITDDILEKYELNKIVIDHKVQEQELLKLKEVAPDYASEIKENLAKNAARDIMKKMTFTKRHDINTDVHHFIGRVWVFTEEELKKLIEEVKNA